MSDRTDEHFKAVLNAIDDITPESPPIVASPPQARARRQPLLVAAASFVVVLLSIGVGILALQPGAIQEGDVAIAPTTLISEGLPHLVLDLPDMKIMEAYEILDDSTGEPIGVYARYVTFDADAMAAWPGETTTTAGPDDSDAMAAWPDKTIAETPGETTTTAGPDNSDVKATWPDKTITETPGETTTTAGPSGALGEDAFVGVKVELSLYKSDVDVERFDQLLRLLHEPERWAAAAENTEIVMVDGREVAVYRTSDPSEGKGLLRWTEARGYEAILVAWGMGSDKALTLLDGLTIVSDDEWSQLTTR